MLIQPIAVVDQVIDEYRRYLLTEFRARDPKLRDALTRALDEPRFLAQEPFYQAHRPFKVGKAWKNLGLDPRLAKVMEERSGSPTAFLHQSEAIEHLLAPEATSLVVTTGTGSGKTECFLLPVIQNAIEDSAYFKQRGLTAILVYPMNALANDQEERIKEYLDKSGHTHVQVRRYDRSTKQDERAAMRKSPPHILLTNYMMLEYLLVRPADREAIFADHRCRFLVLDEVHTYRGSLGTNIALLFRRLRAHLANAAQSFATDDPDRARRFPVPIAVATSATIKSIDETGRTADEVRSLREDAAQGFVGTLTGLPPRSFRVLGEELAPLTVPGSACWPASPVTIDPPALGDAEGTRRVLAALAGLPAAAPVAEAVRCAGILWVLNELLAKRPLSVSGIVDAIRERVPERADADPEALGREVRAALSAGAQLGEVPGALRLRAHRFIRGGWKFHRCVDPACGRLYAMGEGNCTCGKVTAPLLLCRSCGADTLHFGGAEDPETGPLAPWMGSRDGAVAEWLLYDRARLFASVDEDDDEVGEGTRIRAKGAKQQMKGRPVKEGSFDPDLCVFASGDGTYPVRAILAPARTKCLVCGASAGGGSMLTPVALGTSAALRVLAEGVVEGLAVQHRLDPEHDGKERILIFADSRQDAAHQARFITYAGRYDRMRRRLVKVIEEAGSALSVEKAVRALMVRGFELRDNPLITTTKVKDAEFLNNDVKDRALAWEEAPLLDDLAVSAGYRATVLNLGLVGVRYGQLDRYIEKHGGGTAASLGLTPGQLHYLCRCLLDEMRSRRALSRPMLTFHPQNPSWPEAFTAADWERRVKTPQGYPCDPGGRALGSLDPDTLADGINVNNAWRRGKSGAGPRLQRIFQHLLDRMGGVAAEERLLVAVLTLMMEAGVVEPVKLYGYTKTSNLLQVSGGALELVLLRPEDRFRCNVCNVKMPWVAAGSPCRACRGEMVPWPDAEVQENRYVERILARDEMPLVAGEHTAQVTGDERIELEAKFKAAPSVSPVNVLSCSPTLEMGIDVGGLDAVLMRNVPPRPDNYAQRGGRAGRRSRVGIVVGYARSAPHDQYFYDKPQEMIAGEVAAPGIGLGNYDVIVRHLNAIALGAAEPGLAGRMAEYITFKGELRAEAILALVKAFESQFDHAVDLALSVWEKDVLSPARLDSREALLALLREQPARIHDLFDRVRHQILELQLQAQPLFASGARKWPGINAIDLIVRLLGLPPDRDTVREGDADDRSAGHPMRRFAEFGILPGYEFPSEPATLRLLHDKHEEEPVSVVRRFGLAQYQPDATAHARGHRWRVAGLDMASPWNPRSDSPSWLYRVCGRCQLRYDGQAHVMCPRCKSPDAGGKPLPGYEFGGFLAVRDDTPVLEEEDRFALANLLRCYPQWNGDVVSRFVLPTGWLAELRDGEEVRWVNEWKKARESERHCELHEEARGFYLCPSCGHILSPPQPENAGKANKATKKGQGADPYGHSTACKQKGSPPEPLAITTKTPSTTLRILVEVPFAYQDGDYQRWGQSLGYALRTGMRHLYMLDGPEIEFELEPLWDVADDSGKRKRGALTFLDPAVGGSGFLERAAAELHLVARHAIEHLDHQGCETACYRCLKSYQNQRFHAVLSWPHAMPSLEALAREAPRILPRKKWDVFDPKPWIEAYGAGVGSPLELRFLRALEAKGIRVQKQVPIAPEPGGKAITIADFAIPEQHLAIYVDGAAFHVGGNLRRDKNIRDRLRSAQPPWRVEVLTAKDLAQGLPSLTDLFGAFPPVPEPEPEPEAEEGDVVGDGQAAPEEDAWDEALMLLDERWHPLAKGLRAHGIRAPDEVDWDLMHAGRATGERAIAMWRTGSGLVAVVERAATADGALLLVTPESAANEVSDRLHERLGGDAP
jgi:hypothetical protein